MQQTSKQTSQKQKTKVNLFYSRAANIINKYQ